MEGAYWWTSLLNNQPVISGPAVINKISPCPTFSLYSFHFVIFLLIFFFPCLHIKDGGRETRRDHWQQSGTPQPPTTTLKPSWPTLSHNTLQRKAKQSLFKCRVIADRHDVCLIKSVWGVTLSITELITADWSYLYRFTGYWQEISTQEQYLKLLKETKI